MSENSRKKTLVIYYSKHHGNTKKLLDAAKDDFNLDLHSVTSDVPSLKHYDNIILASGIYFSRYHKLVLSFVEKHLPELKEKKIILVNTSGVGSKRFNKKYGKYLESKGLNYFGGFETKGYDTYGIFKFFGGFNKNRPNDNDIEKFKKFLEELLSF